MFTSQCIIQCNNECNKIWNITQHSYNIHINWHGVALTATWLAQLREGHSAWKDMQGSHSLEKSFNFRECREVGEANSSSLEVLLEWTGNIHFCTICEIIFLVGGPWKSNVVLEKSLKNGCNFLYEPWHWFKPCTDQQPGSLKNWKDHAGCDLYLVSVQMIVSLSVFLPDRGIAALLLFFWKLCCTIISPRCPEAQRRKKTYYIWYVSIPANAYISL